MSQSAPQGSQMPSAVVPGLGRAFDHVLIIMFENMYRGYVLGNPYMRRLARQGIQLGNYFGVMHPSQTNYIASIAGELCNVTSDDRPPPLAQRTIVDLLEEAPGRLRWKAYMDSYVPEATPWTADFQPQDALPYFIKHNPFSSFSSIVRSQERWKHIENEASLFADLLNGEFPEYAWFTPNIWNDGHWIDGTEEESKPRAPLLVEQQARWLERVFNRLRFPGPHSHLPPNTLVVVTFDESDFENNYQPDLASTYDGPNQIYTVLLANEIEPGFEEEGYNHYSLLRTIEVNFSLDHLGKNDAGANWFQFLWGRRFEWSAPQTTPLEGFDGPIAAAGYAGALFVACAAANGTICLRTRSADHGRWSVEETLPIDGSGGIAMASTFSELVLVARSAAGRLSCMKYDLQQGWRADAAPSDEPMADVVLASFAREHRIMLAMRDGAGNVTSRVRGEPGTDAAWGKAMSVPAAITDGGMALGTLGESLYLIVKTPDKPSMSVVSYNTAPFNVVSVEKNKYGGPWDNTVVDAWSPSAFPVAHFSSRPNMQGQRQPLARPYETSGPMAIATMDGVMHLVHPGPANPLLLTETFSISGVMTPMKEVSYKNAAPDVNNGFGTLAEAGWSKQSPIFEARCGAGGALAMGRAGRQILLLYRTGAGSPIWLHEGSYVRKGS
ncbi:MAG TPA: alkaline phosphatase family protein [Reyranella sp.]